MKQEKKVNSYLRGIKVIVLACVIGGVIGGVTGAIRFVLLSRGVAVSGDWVLQQIRSLLVSNPRYYFCSDRDIGGTLFP